MKSINSLLYSVVTLVAIAPGLCGNAPDPSDVGQTMVSGGDMYEGASTKAEIVSVNAYVANGYSRTKQSDGQYKPETYAFGEGGRISGNARDKSIENLSFRDIARTIAFPLADRQYIPSKSSRDTDLLIMVYWGTTGGASAGTNTNVSQNWKVAQKSLNLASVTRMAHVNGQGVTGLPPSLKVHYESEAQSALIEMDQYNQSQDRATESTARLIGYSDELNSTEGLKQAAGLGPYRSELLSDIEDDRYFVILVACDFREAWKDKQMRPLWWARYNVRVRGNEFDKALLDMTRFASRYFGQNTHGLVRNRVPIGRVEVGEPTVVGKP
jgi:uncharacterized protein affecting Mg2+/Co2+ transport